MNVYSVQWFSLVMLLVIGLTDHQLLASLRSVKLKVIDASRTRDKAAALMKSVRRKLFVTLLKLDCTGEVMFKHFVFRTSLASSVICLLRSKMVGQCIFGLVETSSDVHSSRRSICSSETSVYSLVERARRVCSR